MWPVDPYCELCAGSPREYNHPNGQILHLTPEERFLRDVSDLEDRYGSLADLANKLDAIKERQREESEP